MEGFAQTTILGTVGQDPEFREVGQEKQVATFSVVTNKSFKTTSGDKKQDSQWHSIECWGSTATFVKEYIKKGNAVFIIGEPRSESWEDKDGVKRTKHKIVADKVKFGGNNSNSSNGEASAQATPSKDMQKKVDTYKESAQPQEVLSNGDFSESVDDLPF
jgi:single-strand DNA-binding protein